MQSRPKMSAAAPFVLRMQCWISGISYQRRKARGAGDAYPFGAASAPVVDPTERGQGRRHVLEPVVDSDRDGD